jgi:hypothetical protein
VPGEVGAGEREDLEEKSLNEGAEHGGDPTLDRARSRARAVPTPRRR